jgi:hypothetical protein
MKDDVLYRALYCGACKSIGKNCGQIGRFTLTYDIAFMNAICHNILGKDVVIKKSRCIAHPIVRKPIAKCDEISDMLGSINIILAYYKLKDDILDENKGGLKSLIFKKGYKKAKKSYPNIDKIVKDCYYNLVKLEKENSDSVDIVSDCFAVMLKEISKEVFLDDDMVSTALGFIENDFNVSETSRKLFLHRNTLNYRLDKIEKLTGLNLRKFSDALTFKLIATLAKLVK